MWEVLLAAVKLVVSAQPARIADCALCNAGEVPVNEVVAVYHADGSAVLLDACERCARASRRIVAAIGRDATLLAGDDGVAAAVVPPRRSTPRVPVPPDLVREYVDQIVGADGMRYVIRVFGQPRADRTWVGWIEFVAVGASRTLRTGVETTQPDRPALAYWAGGLETSYLEGAFARARQQAIRAGHAA